MITLFVYMPQQFRLLVFYDRFSIMIVPLLISVQSKLLTQVPVNYPCHIIMAPFVLLLSRFFTTTNYIAYDFPMSGTRSTQRRKICFINAMFDQKPIFLFTTLFSNSYIISTFYFCQLSVAYNEKTVHNCVYHISFPYSFILPRPLNFSIAAFALVCSITFTSCRKTS